LAQQDDASRTAEVAAWLGLPAKALTGLSDEVIDAIAARMAGSEPAGTTLQRELLDHVAGRISRGRQAEVDALVDPLTGIANRRAWTTMLAFAEAECALRGSCASVIVIDLDNLKHVNDTLGHSAGDELLQGAAAALTTESRECDHVARVGGDEFAVLAVGVAEPEAMRIAERLEARLSAVGIAASVGVASRAETGGLAQAWEDADTAMYEAKWRRKSRRNAPRGEAVVLGVVKRDDVALPGAYVRIASTGGDFIGEVKADSRGRFALHTAPGEWVLICLAPGGGRVERRVTVRTLSEVHVEIEA
jgi:diguanylate cyclase (GGDEF)-like protein